ncbi:farnesol dehydrogenase [Nilaparvata lugens]|uniref:farnesol dehydrogenase n=1 Tax=Nilaparvata lugens TaxID=108931 RepID=UPI00193CADBC|nr:farnesol dehydrogenase [Nilaparvata lugens]
MSGGEESINDSNSELEISNGNRRQLEVGEDAEPKPKRPRCENNQKNENNDFPAATSYGMKKWHLKTAIVTGASSGIGAAISKKLVSAGMNVVGIARRESALQKIKRNMEDEGLTNGDAKFIPLTGDLTDHEVIDKHLEWIDNNLNGIHVLVNNAGIMQISKLMDTEEEYWNRVFQTNVLAVARMTKQVLKIMKKNHFDYGHIINISSVAGNNNSYPIPGMVPYFISKKAVATISEGFRAELSDAQSLVKITTISPGLVRTGIIENSGLSKIIPDDAPALDRSDVAEAVHFVLSTPRNVVISELTIQAITESIHIRLMNPKKPHSALPSSVPMEEDENGGNGTTEDKNGGNGNNDDNAD